MIPVVVQQHTNKLKEAKARLVRARQAFYEAKTEQDEQAALIELTTAYRAKRELESTWCKPVSLVKHVERVQQETRNEQHINWNE